MLTNRGALHLYIYWGSAAGYSTSDRYTLAVGPIGHNMEAADLDMNGYLDLVVTRYDWPVGVVVLYQADARSFVPSSPIFSDHSDQHGLSIGDLDGDGYVDIVATGYAWILYSCIYWGSGSGYSETSKCSLNSGSSYGGSAIADFDGDDLPDIVYFRKPDQNLVIYYNSGSSPFFSDSDTQEVAWPLNATGGVAADFNYDGHPDVFVNNEGIRSYVFYGPSFTSYDSVPVTRDHHGMFHEPRQIRSYCSRIFRPCSSGADTVILGGDISWIASTRGGSKVNIFVRVGDVSTPGPSWTAWYQVVTDTSFGPLPQGVCDGHGYIQYRADLTWENPAELPNLEKVEIDALCGSVGVEEILDTEGDGQELGLQVLPNPLTRKATVEYWLPSLKKVSLRIYDITGRLVTTLLNEKTEAGAHSVGFEAGDWSAGTYFAVLKTDSRTLTTKLVVLR